MFASTEQIEKRIGFHGERLQIETNLGTLLVKGPAAKL